MTIDDILLDKLAGLARLEFAADERSAILRDLNEMVAWVEQLDELVIDNEPIEKYPIVLNIGDLREDMAINTLAHEQALALAPHSDTNYFRVPSVKGTHEHTPESTSQ
jgi:aspartyl-tRNA(Asn)/glutamyl-tRNA(Gln) amidotransferase subunit C